MRQHLSLVLLLASLPSSHGEAPMASSIAEPSPSPGVSALSLGDFSSVVANAEGPLLLVFHAPWCLHCRQLSPLLEQLARTTTRSTLQIWKIDATEERALATRFSIRGYPSLFYLIDRQVYPYTRRRTAQAMLQFATEGYREATPLSFLASPLGPVGRVRGAVSLLGQRLMDVSAWVGKRYNLSKEVVMVGAVFATAFLFVGLFVASIWVSMEMEKRKRD